MDLQSVAALMHAEHLDVLPVVDESGGLLGQVTARGLFAASMPGYFGQMPSLKFLRDFDAFEHFFREKARLPVEKIMERKVHGLSPDTPLAEVIARLAGRNGDRLYVVEGDRLVGVIDNFSIIDKVLSI
jgi:CBS domain-containing protein